MPLSENIAVRVAYKAHSTGAITPTTEPTLGTDPGSSGGQVLRRVTSTLALQKDAYESAEIREDRQVADMRHGTRRPAGEIGGEHSPGTYIDLIEAAFRATKVATFSRSNTEFTSLAATNATSKLTVAASTWAAQGFRVGDVIRPAGCSVAANNRDFLIVALSGVDATVLPAPTDMSADTSFTVDRLGNKLTLPTLAANFVSRKFLFEHYHINSDVTQLFAESRISGVGLAMPATGLNTIRLPVTARNMSIVTGGSSPFFGSPTAAGTDGITASVNGALAVQGAKIGVLTGIEFNMAMAVEAPAVAGQDIVADIFLGRSLVTGQITALFLDETLLNYFVNETEVEIAAHLKTNSAVSGAGCALFLPRVKLGGADIPLQGEGGVPITLPFTALIKPSATGYDNTTVAYSEWTA